MNTRGSHASHWVILSGALAGALAAYLIGTPRGRRLCDRTVLLLDVFSIECVRLRDASMRARSAVDDAWKALEHAALDNTSMGGLQ